MSTTQPSLMDLDAARSRLANAKASRIEFDLAKDKRELLTIPECFSLLKQLRDVALEKTLWQNRSVLGKHLDDALESFSELVRRMQEDAKR